MWDELTTYIEILNDISIWFNGYFKFFSQFKFNLDWLPESLVFKIKHIIEILTLSLSNILSPMVISIYHNHKYEITDAIFQIIEYWWSISKIIWQLHNSFLSYITVVSQFIFKIFFLFSSRLYEKNFDVWSKYVDQLLLNYLFSAHWGACVLINSIFLIIGTTVNKLLLVISIWANDITANTTQTLFKYDIIWADTKSNDFTNYTRKWLNKFFEDNLIKGSKSFFNKINFENYDLPPDIFYQIVIDKINDNYKPFKIYTALKTNPIYEYIYFILYQIQYFLYKAIQIFLIICIKIFDIVVVVFIAFGFQNILN